MKFAQKLMVIVCACALINGIAYGKEQIRTLICDFYQHNNEHHILVLPNHTQDYTASLLCSIMHQQKTSYYLVSADALAEVITVAKKTDWPTELHVKLKHWHIFYINESGCYLLVPKHLKFDPLPWARVFDKMNANERLESMHGFKFRNTDRLTPVELPDIETHLGAVIQQHTQKLVAAADKTNDNLGSDQSYIDIHKVCQALSPDTPCSVWHVVLLSPGTSFEKLNKLFCGLTEPAFETFFTHIIKRGMASLITCAFGTSETLHKIRLIVSDTKKAHGVPPHPLIMCAQFMPLTSNTGMYDGAQALNAYISAAKVICPHLLGEQTATKTVTELAQRAACIFGTRGASLSSPLVITPDSEEFVTVPRIEQEITLTRAADSDVITPVIRIKQPMVAISATDEIVCSPENFAQFFKNCALDDGLDTAQRARAIATQVFGFSYDPAHEPTKDRCNACPQVAHQPIKIPLCSHNINEPLVIEKALIDRLQFIPCDGVGTYTFADVRTSADGTIDDIAHEINRSFILACLHPVELVFKRLQLGANIYTDVHIDVEPTAAGIFYWPRPRAIAIRYTDSTGTQVHKDLRDPRESTYQY